MPKFDVPKIVRKMNVADYAPELNVEIHVWVNPTRNLLRELITCLTPGQDETRIGERKVKRALELWAELWSQGPDGTQWSAEDLTQLANAVVDTDPMLFVWLRDQTLEMIREHRTAEKKS